MLHSHIGGKASEYWMKPTSLDTWQNSNERTIKLDMLVQVVKHHLQCDGQYPMTMEEDGKTITVHNDYSDDDKSYMECNHIIVYAAFPSSNQAILDVSILLSTHLKLLIQAFSLKIFDLYGINAVKLNGSMSMKCQQEALTAFCMSLTNAGPCILILSNVGVVGLNLTCTNIMVIVVCLFVYSTTTDT